MTRKQRTLFEGVYKQGTKAIHAVIKDDKYIGWIRMVPAIDLEGNEVTGIIYGDWIEGDDE